MNTLFGGQTASYLSFLSSFLHRTQGLSAYFKAALYTIQTLAAPHPLHARAARETAGEAEAAELLEKTLRQECAAFAARLFRQPLPETADEEEFIFSSDARLCLDEHFSGAIAKMGPHGKAIAEQLAAASKSWHENYQTEGNRLVLFRLWIDPDRPPYYCRFLTLLAEVLWKDKIEAQYAKSKTQLTALVQTVQRSLGRVLSPRATSVEQSLVYEGKKIAQVAAIDSQLLPLILKGSERFASIYHHKLLRYECRAGFQNWLQGKPEPRILRYEGGETEIADRLGFKFKEAPSIIKSLLHAQAHMRFCFDDGSEGNLIELRSYRSKATHREQGIEITLSTQLMPCYTFQTDRRGRLLVPLPELPPFISAPQYYGGQALLQMLIMEEFTAQSLELSQSGSIAIAEERWDTFCQQSGLPLSIFKKVKDHWLSKGLLCFIEPDRYTLGSACEKELSFFHTQGKLRKERQRQGKISGKKRIRRAVHFPTSVAAHP